MTKAQLRRMKKLARHTLRRKAAQARAKRAMAHWRNQQPENEMPVTEQVEDKEQEFLKVAGLVK